MWGAFWLFRVMLFVLGALVVYRIGTFIPVPGIDAVAWAGIIKESQNTIVGLFNMFSGGALERMSVFALNVMPYISASIIMQLLTAVVPSLEQLKKEGEAGRSRLPSTHAMARWYWRCFNLWVSPLRWKLAWVVWNWCMNPVWRSSW